MMLALYYIIVGTRISLAIKQLFLHNPPMVKIPDIRYQFSKTLQSQAQTNSLFELINLIILDATLNNYQ